MSRVCHYSSGGREALSKTAVTQTRHKIGHPADVPKPFSLHHLVTECGVGIGEARIRKESG